MKPNLSYVLVIRLRKDAKIEVGALGEIYFKKGYYMYVGSAKNGISRVCRHFKKDKKLRWHIDYLTTFKFSEPLFAYLFEEEECKLAENLKLGYSCIPKFGCSDCKCGSHLFYSRNFDEIAELSVKSESKSIKFLKILQPEDCNVL